MEKNLLSNGEGAMISHPHLSIQQTKEVLCMIQGIKMSLQPKYP